ncbi:MAG: helix-turn-helix domain-containing protein [Oricola sp.]|nr:helix-turn-helix domain-containing protein [Oricola sp.]
MLLLACYVSGKGRGSGRHLLARVSSQANREIFDRVAEILAHWPNGFFALLDDIRKFGPRRQRKTGLEAEFKGLYSALFPSRSQDQRYDQLRSAFNEYVQQYWRGGYICARNKRMTELSPDDMQAYPLVQAARIAGVHPSILRREIGANRMQAERSVMGRRSLWMIERAELERYQAVRTKHLTLAEVAARLGLSRKSVLDLVRVGVLPAVHGPRIDGETFWRFRVRDVQTLLGAITRDPRGACAGNHKLKFDAGLRRATAIGLRASDIVEAIRAETLRICRVDARRPGFKGVIFDAEEFSAFLRDARRTINWAVPIQEAARRLRLNEQAARDVVRAGLIPTVIEFSAGRERRLISLDAVDAFKRSYVPASEVASETNTSPRTVVLQLEERGISPVTGPSVDGGRQYFYARCEAIKAFVREAQVNVDRAA